MNNNQVNTEILKQIRASLPYAANKAIARKTGLSCTLISRVLHGKAHNLKVIEAAYTIIEEENIRAAVLTARHNAIIK